MLNAMSFKRFLGCIAAAAVAASLATTASAQSIDLKLIVDYADNSNVNSGGTWELVARSSNVGIAGFQTRLTNVSGPIADHAPRATVNTNDTGGFDPMFETIGASPNYRQISFFQFFEPLGPGEQDGTFYGVGTIPNGEPGDIGHSFTSLTNVQNIPWAAPGTDPAWPTAVLFASGAFGLNVTPGFFAGSTGAVFTAIGTTTLPGPVSSSPLITTSVVTDFDPPGPDLPDYNNDGVVDAADYVFWRKAFTNGTMTQTDYDLWKMHFGETAGPGAGGGNGTVPEPSCGIMLFFAAAYGLFARVRRV